MRLKAHTIGQRIGEGVTLRHLKFFNVEDVEDMNSWISVIVNSPQITLISIRNLLHKNEFNEDVSRAIVWWRRRGSSIDLRFAQE